MLIRYVTLIAFNSLIVISQTCQIIFLGELDPSAIVFISLLLWIKTRPLNCPRYQGMAWILAKPESKKKISFVLTTSCSVLHMQQWIIERRLNMSLCNTCLNIHRGFRLHACSQFWTKRSTMITPYKHSGYNHPHLVRDDIMYALLSCTSAYHQNLWNWTNFSCLQITYRRP